MAKSLIDANTLQYRILKTENGFDDPSRKDNRAHGLRYNPSQELTYDTIDYNTLRTV